ncbi:hypothetical protein CMV_001987 [Castanea mollissima]|uniref:ABC transporter domain-containing protein n=1 Tax=Castanea mollissima TaxID=60419 RepID=A0A8J4RWS9_9ROSI|nr:hypothetical protein CMV_001987 [Castanea mollissima]
MSKPADDGNKKAFSSFRLKRVHTDSSMKRASLINIGKPVNFTGGLEFSSLTYTVTKKKKDVEGKWFKEEVDLLNRITCYAPKGCITAVMGPSGAGKSTLLDGLAGRIASGSLKGRVSLDGKEMSPTLIKRTSAYIMQDDRLFPMLTVYETLMFAADFRLGPISRAEKQDRVDKLIEQLGSGLHQCSSVIEKVHHIARSRSTVILTIHQPSSRIQLLLDHLIILARGQLMFQGSPKDVTHHVSRMGRRVPKGENSIEHLIDVIQEYDQSEHGVEAVAEFASTGLKPPPLAGMDMSVSSTLPPTPTPPRPSRQAEGQQSADHHKGHGKRLQLQNNSLVFDSFDHSVRSPYNNTSRSWSASDRGVTQALRLTPSQANKKGPNSMSLSPGHYAYSSEILPSTPTPHSSDYTVNEDDYRTPGGTDVAMNSTANDNHLGPKFANSFLSEIMKLMRRNFKNIRRTPELFLARLMVLTLMGFMMATMFMKPPKSLQGITDLTSFFIFTVCPFFFSSNDAVPAFIQERFIFIQETSHNSYRASSYTIAGVVTYLPFLAIQAGVYAGIVYFALKLKGPFIYFLIVLYVSLLTTNSFVVFVSSVVPNYILGYAAVIAFTALFFLFCGYFLSGHDIPSCWQGMNKISTMTYPYEGLLINEFQRTDIYAKDPLGNNVSSIDVLDSLKIHGSGGKKWEKVFIMLGWAAIYRILFYIILRFGSKNQRK